MAKAKLISAVIVSVIVAAIISVIGLIGFGGLKGITGFEAGTLNVTVQGTTSIQLTDAASNFGTGYVTSSAASAVIDTAGSKSGWTNTTAFPSSDPMVVINNGTSRANVTIKAGTVVGTFIGGTGSAQKYGSVSAGTNCTGTQVTAYDDLTTSEKNLCSKLEYGSSQALTIKYQLTIPYDAAQNAAARSNTITLMGYAVG
jgi:hypothetical protein